MPESPKYKKSEIRCKLILDAALELFFSQRLRSYELKRYYRA